MTLPEELRGLNVRNVYVYVADAVRWDGLPREVSERGATVKTVASSIHSPASFASITTGRYPPVHRVTDFESRIPESLPTLFDITSHDTVFWNTLGEGDGNDPIYSVLDEEPPAHGSPFDSVSEPFIVVERTQGGHAPYGRHSGTAAEYFEDHRTADLDTIRDEYYLGIEEDASHFESRLASLSERNLAADTLVIYTSDHGELLGEGGMFGHNGAIRSELVYVPTVFAHSEIPDTTLGRPFGHTDLFPWILEVLNVDSGYEPSHGGDRTRRRYSFYESQFRIDILRNPTMKYDSVWNADGGIVRANSPSWVRAVGALDDLFDSQQRFLSRRPAHLPNLLRSYVRKQVEFGDPNFDFDVEEDLCSYRSKLEEGDAVSTDLDDTARERLRELGYW